MNSSDRQMLEDLEDAISQAYAMINPEEPLMVEPDGAVDTSAFDTTDTPHNIDPDITTVDTTFITSLYSIYFDLKFLHWNTFSRTLHNDTDEAIKLLLEFIDNYTEIALTNPGDLGSMAVTDRIIKPLDFINGIIQQLKLDTCNYASPENNSINSITFNFIPYPEILEALLFKLTTEKNKLEAGSSINTTAAESENITAKLVLIDDMIAHTVKLTYKSKML
jgi:hypothetical protein